MNADSVGKKIEDSNAEELGGLGVVDYHLGAPTGHTKTNWIAMDPHLRKIHPHRKSIE